MKKVKRVSPSKRLQKQTFTAARKKIISLLIFIAVVLAIPFTIFALGSDTNTESLAGTGTKTACGNGGVGRCYLNNRCGPSYPRAGVAGTGVCGRTYGAAGTCCTKNGGGVGTSSGGAKPKGTGTNTACGIGGRGRCYLNNKCGPSYPVRGDNKGVCGRLYGSNGTCCTKRSGGGGSTSGGTSRTGTSSGSCRVVRTYVECTNSRSACARAFGTRQIVKVQDRGASCAAGRYLCIKQNRGC